MNEVQIHILISPEKGLVITGAIQDPIMAYGILELAKDALREMRAKQASAIVQPVKSLPVQFRHD
jgi:hypothetical protein